jgi:hypothetical protein
MMAWDGKAITWRVYITTRAKTKLFVYDHADEAKKNKQVLEFDQIQDMKYMPDGKTLFTKCG